MKEADLGQSFENFIARKSPLWGIRFRYPDGFKTLPVGDELLTDIVIIHGSNVEPPKNEKGEHATGALKVRIT